MKPVFVTACVRVACRKYSPCLCFFFSSRHNQTSFSLILRRWITWFTWLSICIESAPDIHVKPMLMAYTGAVLLPNQGKSRSKRLTWLTNKSTYPRPYGTYYRYSAVLPVYCSAAGILQWGLLLVLAHKKQQQNKIRKREVNLKYYGILDSVVRLRRHLIRRSCSDNARL